jgi:hypothetical protein
LNFEPFAEKFKMSIFFNSYLFPLFLILERKRKRRVGRFVGIPPKEKKKDFRQKNEKQK